MTTTIARMIQRSDTTTGWAADNPVLADGELGWDSDLKQLKIGNGADTWDVLDWFGLGGGGGGSLLGYFAPEDYGAVGDGVANDTAALQAAEDAAHAAGGGIVLLAQKYGWTGNLTHRGNVTLMGVGPARYTVTPGSIGDPDRGLIALDDTAVLLVGTNATANSQDDNPGPVMNLVINGAGVGGTGAALVRLCNGADAQVVGVHIINSGGDGVECAGHQNFTFDRCLIGYAADGAAISMYNTTGQGVGNGKFNNCYVATSRKLLYTNVAAAQFWPHDTFFNQCLFENYDDTGTNDLIHLEAGEFQFTRCVFTNSNTGVPPLDCVVLIEQTVNPAIATVATFDSCYFNGGTTGVTHLIRTKGAVNHLRFDGRTHVSNGDFIIGIDGGNSDVEFWGTVLKNAGTLTWYEGINGGTVANVRCDTAQPMRWSIPDDASGLLGFPIQVRRETDGANRFSIDRDGVLRWFDGTNGGDTKGSLFWDSATDRMVMGGTWQVQNAYVRRQLVVNVTTVGQDVDLSAADTALPNYVLVFTAGSTADVTLTGGVDGSQIRVEMSGTGYNVINWPGNIFFRGTAPQPMDGVALFVDLERVAGNWFEVSRSSDVVDQEREARVTTGQEVFSRDLAVTSGTATVSQLVKLSYFTAYKTETITKLASVTGSTAAAATPTLCRMGLYSVAANGDLTLVASTANDTALWAATNTVYEKAISSPASYNVLKGKRYAFATLIVTGAAAPSMAASTQAVGVVGIAPRQQGQLSGQSDLPASISAGSVQNGGVRHYGELRP